MRRFWNLVFVILLALPLTAAQAGDALQVFNIRYSATSSGARVVFDVNRKAEGYQAFTLGDPYRLIVDLPASKWSTFKSRFSDNSLVKSWEQGANDQGGTRVTFYLRKPALVDSAFTLPKDDFNKNRLVIDLKPVSLNVFNARMGEAKDKEKTVKDDGDARTASASKKSDAAQRQYVIVVDAGHGGEDPGASSHGVVEKNLTLAVARELRQQLEQTGRYKVVLTRDRDVYIKLRDRVDISRKVGADLFVSIHADKIGRDNVRGTSMYTLSEKASDTETERLADDENNSGFVAGVDLGQETQDVADILLDLAMREKMNESNLFARYLTHSLLDNDIRLLPKSHRSAGFAVLKAPDVPSVLIETGFLSNADEAKLLTSSQFQDKLASAILGGIDSYFRKMRALEKR